MVYAGMDVGTSGCKLLAYDLDGRVVFHSQRRYQEKGTGTWRELNPNVVLDGIMEVLADAGKHCPEKIEAMAVTCLGESVVCLDENDCVLANSMLTGDSRGIAETERLIEQFGRQRIFEITGLPPNELYGLPKYMWLNENTDAVKRAKAILFYEDFAGYILTGERKVSYTSAARSMAFDIHRKDWSEELLSAAGICREQMSEPVAPCTVVGTIRPELAVRLHLNPDLKVVAGGHDQSCAALGSGLVGREDAECGMGTCEFTFAMLPGPMMTPEMLRDDFPCIPYILPDTYLTSMEVTTCGILKNWARECLFGGMLQKCEAEGTNFFASMDRLASDLDTEVMVLPQFGSSGNPDLSMDARGTITGLTIHTRPEELYLALYEGMAFQTLLAYKRVEPLGVHMERLVATGGGAASELNLQVMADIFGKKVVSLESGESGTLACMMMAATALGEYPSLEEAIRRAVRIKKEYLPDEKRVRYYKKKFDRYQELYERMHDFK
ncbi:MAG: hypothetical protein LUI13_04685 [Lachnospiraceae bacterium]|nr:hypothetical protein [Lachnospiraceae bacterium]